ncbi:MAG: 6-carboxytetrahydropterin synthase [Sulfuricurvum sp.]
MIIRKMFRFENAHIVRLCSTRKCKTSIHGHSYKVEVLFESHALDNAGMIYDFGLIKHTIEDIFDSFDHTITLWVEDDAQYIADMKKHSLRYIVLPYSPSAEQFARIFFVLVDRVFAKMISHNGESGVSLHSIVVHETDTGYAQAFRDDAYNKAMGEIDIEQIEVSDEIFCTTKIENFWQKLKSNESFKNPLEV